MSQQLLDKIWNKDPSAWNGPRETIKQRLGWITSPTDFQPKGKDIQQFSKSTSYSTVVLLGMGGSSLVSRVFASCLSRPIRNFHVLDTTDPATILSIQNHIRLEDTLFIVASKSGTTIEVHALCEYFFGLCPHPEQFIAITDFNTPLMRYAEEKKFRHIFVNPADIGGRFSALSYFGLVPFALMGGHVEDLLSCAKDASRRCIERRNNPAWEIANFIYENSTQGRNKLTFLTTDSLNLFPYWIEQLIAESTGKEGRGIFPVIENPSTFEAWNEPDRIFATFETSSEHLESKISRPHISRQITMTDELGAEFFIWEFATAILGALFEINPFDEPNVVFSKKKTWGYLQEPAGIRNRMDQTAKSPSIISDFLGSVKSPEFIAILSYLPESSPYPTQLKNMLNPLGVSVSINTGPRYLHSTGQFHKGGPNQGRFIILVDDQTDLPIPGENYGFQTLKIAQALGDYEALQEAYRKVVMVKI